MNHIELAIQDLDNRINRLTAVRDQLRSVAPLLGATEIIVPATSTNPRELVPATGGAKAKRTYTRRSTKPSSRKGVASSGEPAGGSVLNNPRTIGAIRKLAQPFNAAVLVSNAIMEDMKSAANWLHRAKAKGWVTGEKGQFTRTLTFGGEPLSPVPPAQDKASRLEMLKQRDAAITANS